MKTVLEILNRYTPDATARAILEKAQNPVVRADKESRALQMEMDFPCLVEKDELYRIEEAVAAAYELNYVKFLPHYPPDLFTADYVPELLKETERVGVVARGFFWNIQTFSGGKQPSYRNSLHPGRGHAFDQCPHPRYHVPHHQKRVRSGYCCVG